MKNIKEILEAISWFITVVWWITFAAAIIFIAYGQCTNEYEPLQIGIKLFFLSLFTIIAIHKPQTKD